MTEPQTIVSILRARAGRAPDRLAHVYLPMGADDPVGLSYAELDRRARAMGMALADRIAATETRATETCVLIALPAGLDFLVGFFGCLYAGAIAVPVRYPNPRRPLTHLTAVMSDSGAAIAITTAEMRDAIGTLPGDPVVLTLADANDDPAGWEPPSIAPEAISHLQYTSGSTASPKGVIIRHNALLANSNDLQRTWGITPESRILSWLPHYHDLGLVFGCIQPVHAGCTGHIMNPATFAQRPLAWLEAIGEHRITHTAAPDFAYRTCAALPADRCVGLELSSLQVAANGAEPVRAQTIHDFARAFAPHGFRPEAMCPAYGLAETTLMATTTGPDRPLTIACVAPDALAEGKLLPIDASGRALVACGGVATSSIVRIVDPETHRPVDPGATGEIWISGPSTASGYWRRAEASAERFGARLADDAAGTNWLRTGDLGGLIDGDLFVLGRIDDLIVVRGVNHAAEDIELCIEPCDPALQPGGGAAFGVDVRGQVRVVVAHELRRDVARALRDEPATAERIIRSIRRAVSENHDLEVAAVVLLAPHGLPRTHSGKKQRHACRRAFLAKELTGLASWRSPRLAPEAATEDSISTPDDDRSIATDLTGWLRSYAAERLNSRLIDERRSIPPYVVLDLGNRGLLGLVAPKEYGGLGIGNRALAGIVQQLAAIDTTLASFVLVNNGLGVRPIVRHATPNLREALLPQLATGRELAAFAMTEVDAGSNIRNLAAIGRPNGAGGWSLWGTKRWSGSANWAGVINTFVRLEGDGPDAPRGVSGFVLRQGSAGLRCGPEALTMGMRGMVQNDVVLEGVRVTANDRLGALGEGMVAAMDTMEFGRFAIAAMSVGIIKRCVQLMVRHGTRRRVATGRLIDNPATMMRLGDLTAAAMAVEALTDTVAALLDRDVAVPPELFCVCKTAGPEFAWRAADGLVQQLAGRGYVETNIAPQILRDTRVLRIFEGPTEPMNMHVGSRLVHKPEALIAFVSGELGEPALAVELRETAKAIWARATTVSVFADERAAKQWAYLQIGETASYAILLACVRHRARSAPSVELARAERWCRIRLDRRFAKALGTTAATAALLDANALDALAADYAGAIGDIDQSMASEEYAIDSLLVGGARAVRAPAVPIADAAHAIIPDDGIVDWLRDWIAAEYGVDRASVTATDRFADFGMDSVSATLLSGALQQRFGVLLSPTLVWEYPTLGAVAAHVAAAIVSAPTRQRIDDLSLLARIDDLSEAELETLLADYHPASAA